MSDALTHLNEHYRANAKLSDNQRIAWILSDRWVMYGQAELALRKLEELLSYPPRDRMPCLLIFGATGMGKTKILKKFHRDHGTDFQERTGITHMPVAMMQMGPEPNESDFYSELLRTIGAPHQHSMTLARTRDLCRQILVTMGVRMLIIDEIHNLLAGTARQQRVFLNTLRFLANDLRIPLVCVGTDDARLALLTDRQLAERFDALELTSWTNNKAFGDLMVGFERSLPLRAPSDLTSPEVRARILDMTAGITNRIFRLIETVATLAITTGAERITLADFENEELVLPLVSMAPTSQKRLRRVAATS